MACRQATMAFNIILEALTLAMHRLESLSDLAVRLRRLEHLEDALGQRRTAGIHGSLGRNKNAWAKKSRGVYDIRSLCLSMLIYYGWWFGTFVIFPYIGNSHPNWLIFFRGVQTTNQYYSIVVSFYGDDFLVCAHIRS